MTIPALRGALTLGGLALLLIAPARAQLPPGNAQGVSTGHVHLRVPDVARHRQIWTDLGGVARASGRLELIEFPGIFVLLAQGEPEAASVATSANHIGFSVRDYAAYRQKLEALGASFFYESADNGQLLADLPDGVRIEILTDRAQSQPIAFHHMHLAAPDVESLRDWYIEVFGAEAGERRGLPSALVPGGRVDFLPAQGAAPRGSRGAAIDHIGFEVRDMDAFAAHLADLGIAFDSAPRSVEAIGLTIAFVTDPVGTYIEITQGLAAVE
jgi:catechol 2,3-dioxygenase-like lactoylglutathione lyase family enzyme